MTSKLKALCVLSAALAFFPAFAQQPQRTDEQRLSALENQLASLETRLGVRTTLGAPSSAEISVHNQATAQRIAQLERRLDSLTADVKRIDRQADAAMREASQARRDAMRAQQMARDVASRLR